MRALTVAALSAQMLALAPAGASAFALVQFQSPSRNIGCVLAADPRWFVRCDIARHSWPTPRKPPGFCRELDYGSGLQLGARGRASFVCAGDTTLGAGRILGYGRQISGGPLRCTSLRTGMRCVSRRSGHGFLLSRSAPRRF